jgi:hypothetical protein
MITSSNIEKKYNTILHSNGKKKVVVLSHFESLFNFVKGDNT